ncbi:MAG TPA: BamA/TamA family outer membrane protein [Gemmatimonadales bacterium]|nr:BamA/TamA family outer membrane protein [Gemmatimonadales bacterium]
MRFDRAAGAALVSLVLRAGLLAAQDAPSAITPATQVSRIEFRYTGTMEIPEEKLREEIALTARGGMVGLRKLLGFLPFVPPVGQHPFDPIELQRDVVRIRNLYHESGFLRADVDYDVKYDAGKDLIDVAYVIDEGPPLLLRRLGYGGENGGPPPVPADAADEWRALLDFERKETRRLGQVELQGIAARAGRWFRARGFPFATARGRALVDTAGNRADVTVEIAAGPRTRIREFDVTGNAIVPGRHLTRQLPIRPGDWYDAEKLERGRAQLVQLDIVRLALFDVPRESLRDSTVAVHVEVTENPPNLISGDVGFVSDGGLTSQAEWTNRSFLRGVRTLTVGVVAQTGILALEDQAQRLYRLGLTLFQPYVGHRRLSAAVGPFVEYRDDLRDRSWAVGAEGSLVWAVTPLQSVSLGYTYARRHVYEYGLGQDLQPEEYLPILGLAGPGEVRALEEKVDRGVVRLEGSYGFLDEFANPRRGFVLRPRLELTAPAAFNTSDYVKLELGGTAFLPLTRGIGLALRGSAGRIWPYGGGLPTGGESPFLALLRLRDVTFTAGGTRDVRGWGAQLVGPKIPEVRQTEDSTGFFSERYTPLGGLARLSGSVEVRMPLPGFAEEWQTFAFLDGGRVSIPDERFTLGRPDLEQDDFFAAVGGGISYQTVVGAVQVALGYKLNPSALDLRAPEDVLAALEEGRPVTDAEERGRRRLHLHFAIGSTF